MLVKESEVPTINTIFKNSRYIGLRFVILGGGVFFPFLFLLILTNMIKLSFFGCFIGFVFIFSGIIIQSFSEKGKKNGPT